MKKAGGGDVSKMTRDQRLASKEKSTRAMTPAETRSLQAIKTAKAAAPKQGPLIKPARQMTPAERRMNEMDRPTNSRGAEAYKSGGKVGGSKVPFAVKKVMRKAEGGAVAAPQAMTLAKPERPEITPPVSASDMVRAQQAAEMARLMGGNSPGPMPTMPQEVTPSAPMVSPEYLQAMQEMRAMQDMQAQREAAQIRRDAAPRFMR
jgi:hypothetical protein